MKILAHPCSVASNSKRSNSNSSNKLSEDQTQANKSSASEREINEHQASADYTARRFFYGRSFGLCALAAIRNECARSGIKLYFTQTESCTRCKLHQRRIFAQAVISKTTSSRSYSEPTGIHSDLQSSRGVNSLRMQAHLYTFV